MEILGVRSIGRYLAVFLGILTIPWGAASATEGLGPAGRYGFSGSARRNGKITATYTWNHGGKPVYPLDVIKYQSAITIARNMIVLNNSYQDPSYPGLSMQSNAVGLTGVCAEAKPGSTPSGSLSKWSLVCSFGVAVTITDLGWQYTCGITPKGLIPQDYGVYLLFQGTKTAGQLATIRFQTIPGNGLHIIPLSDNEITLNDLPALLIPAFEELRYQLESRPQETIDNIPTAVFELLSFDGDKHVDTIAELCYSYDDPEFLTEEPEDNGYLLGYGARFDKPPKGAGSGIQVPILSWEGGCILALILLIGGAVLLARRRRVGFVGGG